MESVTSYSGAPSFPPETDDVVRMEVGGVSGVVLTPNPDGSTFVQIAMTMDPHMNVPSWLINLAVRNFAFLILYALRGATKKVVYCTAYAFVYALVICAIGAVSQRGAPFPRGRCATACHWLRSAPARARECTASPLIFACSVCTLCRLAWRGVAWRGVAWRCVAQVEGTVYEERIAGNPGFYGWIASRLEDSLGFAGNGKGGPQAAAPRRTQEGAGAAGLL
jgi:hypothetical protein